MFKNPVYIHGYAFSSRIFRDFAGIKIDLPFHGKSVLHYQDLTSLARAIGLALPCKHDVVGWSMGASLSLLIAFLFPSKVNRIILIGATPCFSKAWRESRIRAFLKGLSAGKEELIENFRMTALGKSFKDSMDIKGSYKLLKDFIEVDLSHILPHIYQEVIIVHGVSDPIVPVKEAFKLANLLKNARLKILPGGHFPVRNEKDLISAVF